MGRSPPTARRPHSSDSMKAPPMQRRSALVASLAIVLLAACSSAPKKNKELAYHAESFNPDSPFEMSFEQAPAAVCDAGRRALLSQGYVIEEIKPDWVKARKFFQPNSSVHVQINFTLSCLTEGEGAEVFANAREVRDELKSTSSNAGVSVAGIGSVNLPLGTSGASLVKVGEETITDSEFYGRFFALMQTFIR